MHLVLKIKKKETKKTRGRPGQLAMPRACGKVKNEDMSIYFIFKIIYVIDYISPMSFFLGCLRRAIRLPPWVGAVDEFTGRDLSCRYTFSLGGL